MAQQSPPKKQFQYQNFQLLPQESLGIGSYGKVCKAILDQLPCAAKLLHPVLFQFNDPASETIVQRFEQECEFLSEIRHPHVVQYLGVARDPESGLLVLLMELMDESLTAFLERSNEPLPYHLQVNLCHDVALALAYLHLNGIIHRDLSSNNVLLIAGSRAKVTDFGMSKLSAMHPRMTPLTQCPGTLAYMPPEALKVPPVYSKKLDIFSSGVVAVQIMTRHFPNPGPAMMDMEIEDTRFPSGTVLVPVLEVERRKNHIHLINSAHPLLPVALNCLKNRERERPSAQELCHRIATLKVEPQYSQSVQEREREGGRGAAEVLATKDRAIQERDNVIQEKENRIRNLHEEMGVLDRRLQMAGIQVRRLQDMKIEELRLKDEELQRKDEVVQEKSAQLELQSQELYQKNQELDQKNRELEVKNRELQKKDHQLQQLQLQLVIQATSTTLRQAIPTSFTFKVSGVGLETATIKTPSQFSVETYPHGGPCPSSQHVTAELNSTTTSSVTTATVVQKSPGTYEVMYTPATRGRHELCVRVNGDEIQGSPFRVIVYPDPNQLRQPVRVIEEGVRGPLGVAFNSHGKMYVTESSLYLGQVAVLDNSGKRISTIGSKGHRPGQFECPYYIAISSDDNVYLTSKHKLQKFNMNRNFVKSVGSGCTGSKPGEFNFPRGVKVHQNQVYVCDFHNNRIQVFDSDLLFVTCFGTKGSGQGQYDGPNDLAFDSQGNIYVSEDGNNRVQVLDPKGRYLRQFGDKRGPGKLNCPEGVHIAHNCAYVSDSGNHRIAVFQLSGAFLTSFGKEGDGRGEFQLPHGIVFDCDGFLYVCDWLNNRIQVF